MTLRKHLKHTLSTLTAHEDKNCLWRGTHTPMAVKDRHTCKPCDPTRAKSAGLAGTMPELQRLSLGPSNDSTEAPPKPCFVNVSLTSSAEQPVNSMIASNRAWIRGGGQRRLRRATCRCRWSRGMANLRCPPVKRACGRKGVNPQCVHAEGSRVAGCAKMPFGISSEACGQGTDAEMGGEHLQHRHRGHIGRICALERMTTRREI